MVQPLLETLCSSSVQDHDRYKLWLNPTLILWSGQPYVYVLPTVDKIYVKVWLTTVCN